MPGTAPGEGGGEVMVDRGNGGKGAIWLDHWPRPKVGRRGTAREGEKECPAQPAQVQEGWSKGSTRNSCGLIGGH